MMSAKIPVRTGNKDLAEDSGLGWEERPVGDVGGKCPYSPAWMTEHGRYSEAKKAATHGVPHLQKHTIPRCFVQHRRVRVGWVVCASTWGHPACDHHNIVKASD